MAINRRMKALLKALSYTDLDLQASRALANLKAVDPLKNLAIEIDHKFMNGDYEVPTRIYIPDSNAFDGHTMALNTLPVLLFFHGGGFVTESVDTYNRVCRNLAKSTRHVVISVDYRLAPEYKFPTGIEDCYAVAKAIFCERAIMNVDPENITIMGDSAGGNIAAVLCQMARDRGDFTPRRQILIYPCVDCDYSPDSKYPSVIENGTDYLLTRQDMAEYIELYKSSDADLDNPYLAPIKAKSLAGLPKTLLITAEFDPLRDEGEAYGARLAADGVSVEAHRIPDALHGFFALSTRHFHVKTCLGYINAFLEEVREHAESTQNEVAQP